MIPLLDLIVDQFVREAIKSQRSLEGGVKRHQSFRSHFLPEYYNPQNEYKGTGYYH